VIEAGGAPDGSLGEWLSRGSIYAALQDVYLRALELVTDAARLTALQRIAKLNFEAAHEAAILTMKLARTDDARRAGLAALEANAAIGHSGVSRRSDESS
jgi:hypothetical protein